jgi:hypothetical protein
VLVGKVSDFYTLGSDTAVRTPYVLTTGPVGTSLVTAELSTATGSVNPAQMWQSILGPL